MIGNGGVGWEVLLVPFGALACQTKIFNTCAINYCQARSRWSGVSGFYFFVFRSRGGNSLLRWLAHHGVM